MAKFLLVYKGGKMAETPEAQQAQMNAWISWLGGLGSAVVDGGNPFSNSVSIANGGAVTTGGGAQLTGYSLLSADSIDAATKMAAGCPVLGAGGGSVEVYEAFNAM